MAESTLTCPICGMPTEVRWEMDANNPTESIQVVRCVTTRCVYHRRLEEPHKEEPGCGLGECWCW